MTSARGVFINTTFNYPTMPYGIVEKASVDCRVFCRAFSTVKCANPRPKALVLWKEWRGITTPDLDKAR